MTNPIPEELEAQVLRFLQRHKTAVLGTMSPEGTVQGATVSYIWDDEFNFYFITRRDSRKFRNMAANPRVSIVVGTEPSSPGTIQAEGIAKVIEDPHFMVHYFTEIVDITKPEWWPLFGLSGMDFVFFQVKIDWLRWLDLDVVGYPATYQEHFRQIIPRA